MKDWFILLCIGIIAVLAFRERDRWLPQSAAPAAAVPAASSPQAQKADLPSVNPPGVQLMPGPSELASLVARSQRLATARYPALGVANSEINIRFNFRYKRLLDEHSPRLQDPAWPMQLADECAQASRPLSVVSPVGASGQVLKVSQPGPGPGANPGFSPGKPQHTADSGGSGSPGTFHPEAGQRTAFRHVGGGEPKERQQLPLQLGVL